MQFDSIFFLSCFFPLILALYWLLPQGRATRGLLLAASLVFFSFSGLTAVPLVLGFALVNYLAALGIHRRYRPKFLKISVLVFDLAFLAGFKYLDFLLTQVLGLGELPFTLAAPLGISFFVFRAISYVVDLSRDPGMLSGSFFDFLLYLTFFPQATAGPISRFSRFTQLPRASRWDAGGLPRFVLGLGKKALLCGVLGNAVDTVYALAPADLSLPLAWVGAIGYTLQIYFDFSGYSDMAIGLSRMLGFSAPENFHAPYAATSLGDFWRRWHMSLSGWFRDYLYIPLGGNRKGKLRTACNKFLVFTLCGLWHGAGWPFLVWGAWHGCFTALESLGFRPGKIWGRVYTLAVVVLGFVMFRAPSLDQGFAMLQAMFTGFRATPTAVLTLHRLLTPEFLVTLGISLLLCTPQALARFREQDKLSLPGWIFCLAVFLLSLLALAGGGFAPFIYARF